MKYLRITILFALLAFAVIVFSSSKAESYLRSG